MSQESQIIIGLSRDQLRDANFDPVKPEEYIKQQQNQKQESHFQQQSQQFTIFQQPQKQQDVFQTERLPPTQFSQQFQQTPKQDSSPLKQQNNSPIQYNNFVGNQQNQQTSNVSGSFYKKFQYPEQNIQNTSSKFSYGGKEY